MDLLKLGRGFACLSLPLMLTACVTTSEHEALQAQVSQMNRQMSTSQTSQADSWSQLVELRQEVAELRGQIDTLNNIETVNVEEKIQTKLMLRSVLIAAAHSIFLHHCFEIEKNGLTQRTGK